MNKFKHSLLESQRKEPRNNGVEGKRESLENIITKEFSLPVFSFFAYGGWICFVLVAKSYPTLATPWTVVCQASLSMGFPKQEYWSGLPFPSPEDLPDLGVEL